MLVCAYCGRAYEVGELSAKELDAMTCPADDCPSNEGGTQTQYSLIDKGEGGF